MAENNVFRGSLTFFTTYRPNVKTDIYSCPFSPKSLKDETCMTDHVSYNYSGQSIPPHALKLILKKIQSKEFKPFPSDIERNVDKGLVSGLLFVSERKGGLETLHFSISDHNNSGTPKVFQFSDVYDTYCGVRMEDSGCFAGDYLIYVSTMEPIYKDYPTNSVLARRQPWTAVYQTDLKSGKTTRLTPPGQADLSPEMSTLQAGLIPVVSPMQADLSPAVSPSGKKIAVASFQGKPNGWDGEIEYLETNIFVFNVNEPKKRTLVVKGGGWPTWGSENVLYFHKLEGGQWGVFRVDVTDLKPTRVTPTNIDAFTPVALDETKVAVVTIRKKTTFEEPKNNVEQYRHIEIFEYGQNQSTPITQNIKPLADHYNPFLIPASESSDGEDHRRFGYHRSNLESCPMDKGKEELEKIESPEANVELFRVSGAFPSYSPDSTKLAFVDNEFKTVYVIFDVNGEKKVKAVHEEKESNRVFAPVWNKNPNKDTLYFCRGPAFSPTKKVEIHAILNVCRDGGEKPSKKLTCGLFEDFNNAFPNTNPDGTRLVFRSTKDGGEKRNKNLYIIENLEELENAEEGTVEANITRLTKGNCVDTHCEWSPNGNWIAFASNRDKKTDDLDHGLDTGRFAVYLVNPNDPRVLSARPPESVSVKEVAEDDPYVPKPIRVIYSRSGDLAGHVNHPVFSPDGKSLAVVSDLAAVSCDPISLPHFIHSVRPYGDLFVVDIDNSDITNNENIQDFRRVTHSRYENSTAVWTKFSCNKCPLWEKFCSFKKQLIQSQMNSRNSNGGETRYVSGHICIAQRSC